ncbi:MAG: glycine cleavage system protein H [Candidatus Cloacimonetes bacterium]|nr:glycine cleavage system protein H [Candidatus Cloacimonadota bacterium]MCK9333243.1 glycine cleavage system protein H [Candidatus Cloacimonadota bacterium]MDD3379047.1 glycine cleavage system protein H [Candidatus Methanomethylophilaceae archaeon]
MSNKENLLFTADHLWLKPLGNEYTLGVTEEGADELGMVVFVELPQIGTELKVNDGAGSLESVKTVAPILSPISGTIVAVNNALEDDPQFVNKASYGLGWIMKIKASEPFESREFISRDEYKSLLKG